MPAGGDPVTATELHPLVDKVVRITIEHEPYGTLRESRQVFEGTVHTVRLNGHGGMFVTFHEDDMRSSIPATSGDDLTVTLEEIGWREGTVAIVTVAMPSLPPNRHLMVRRDGRWRFGPDILDHDIDPHLVEEDFAEGTTFDVQVVGRMP